MDEPTKDTWYLSTYCCLCGDLDYTVLTQVGCFIIWDAQDRDWLCFEVPVTDFT